MNLLTAADFRHLTKAGVDSIQVVAPHNVPDSRVTITRVTVAPGAEQKRHRHERSEQIWIAVSGAGELLLEDGKTAAFLAGDVARFADGDIHGFRNTGPSPFVYMSVTAPPIDFAYAYDDKGPAAS